MRAEWEGKEKEVRKAEEEERGLDLSKSDQVSKKTGCHCFLPAAKADLLFPPDGWRPLDCGHRVTEALGSYRDFHYIKAKSSSRAPATDAYLSYLATLSPLSTAHTTFRSFLYKDVASNRNKETANFFLLAMPESLKAVNSILLLERRIKKGRDRTAITAWKRNVGST